MARALPLLLLLAALALPATAAAAPDNADLSINVSDAPDPVDAGANLTYTVVVANAAGSGRTAANVNVSFPLPAGTTFVSAAQDSGPGFNLATPAIGAGGSITASGGALPPGAAARFTLVARVDTSVGAGSVLGGTATSSSSTADPVSGNNSSTYSTPVTVHADLLVRKTAVDTSGGSITWQISVVNRGPSPAQSVDMSDPLPPGTRFTSATAPAGWTLSTPAVGGSGTIHATRAALDPGQAATFSLTTSTDPGLPDPTLIQNTVSIASSTPDPAADNNSATATAGVGTKADLAVTASGAPASVAPGGTVKFAVTLANNGVDAKDVVLRDTLPDGLTFVSATQTGGEAGFNPVAPAVGGGGSVTFSVGSLAAGASATFEIEAAVAAGAAPGTSIANAIVATTTTAQTNADNDTAVVTTTVAGGGGGGGGGNTRLVVKASAKPAGAKPGKKVTLSFRVRNRGDAAATKARLAGALPSGLKRVKVSGGTCKKGARISCALGRIDPGKAKTVTATVRVKRRGALKVSVRSRSAEGKGRAATVAVKRR